MTEAWYRDGLKFTCTQCGDCCTGAPGYVWVNSDEIDEMVRLTGAESRSEFERQYVRRIGVRKSLKEHSNGDCVFFDPETRKCNVYQARPRQCRSWPFWDSNLRSPEAWKQTCEVCPGSGSGNLVPLEGIEANRKMIRI
jgi:hypothetical protein